MNSNVKELGIDKKQLVVYFKISLEYMQRKGVPHANANNPLAKSPL